MKDKKSSYYKQYRFSVFVIIFLFICVGVLTISFTSAVFKRYKLGDLSDKGEMFIKYLKNEYKTSGTILDERTYTLHSDYCRKFDLDIFVYDKDGVCILSGSDYDSETFSALQKHEEVKPLSDAKMKLLNSGKYLSDDASSFSSSEPSMVYGRRITLKNEYLDDEPEIYVLCYGEIKDINSFIIMMTVLFIVFSAAGIVISAHILKRRTAKSIEYETGFARISEKYSKGDFSEKLPTDAAGLQKDIAEYVNALATNVEQSDSTSKTFIANVSHELRTPITTVGGFVDGILDGTIPKSRQNEYLILVSKEIHRLKILISSMLNMTKFESGTMRPNFRETNLTDLVIQTVLMFEKKIEDKKLDVQGLDSDRLVAVADSDLMQQVIYNLVENAVKFVNVGGTLSFRFEKENGINIISIRNTGEGLKDNEIQQVFDRFYKTDSSRGKDTTGLGLGLSISRKIVHLHSGHIVVKSVYGEYTEFQIQIPDIKINRKDQL